MTDESSHTIETMLLEERRYPPPADFAAAANAQPGIYDEPWESFWEREGRERLTWFEPFETLLEWDLPYAKWYLGGKLNVSYNCVDRHVENGIGDKVAYYWEGEPEGDRRAITFADLQREVVRCANALKQLGVQKGTAVGIYMGMVPETAVAMLACARLGAPHTVVFGGFSADALADRLHDMGCRVLITQDEAWRRGTKVPLKQTADEALADSPTVEKVLVLRRTGGDVPMTEGRDVWWHDARHRRIRVSAGADGQRGSALPPLHVRNDREAEGDRAHDRRLPGRRLDDAPLHLRPQAGVGVLVRGRRRLGDRPQLHRLRAVVQRRDERHVRRHAGLSRQGPVVGDRRALRGRHPLHGADGDPDAHEVGAGVRRESTTCRRFASSARSASRSTRKPGSGTTSTSAESGARSSTPGGRPRRG